MSPTPTSKTTWTSGSSRRHARPAQSARSGQPARVLLGAARPRCPTRSPRLTQVKENFGTDPVLPRGYGADYNDTAYPFYPGDRAALSAGQAESWFFGEPLATDGGHGSAESAGDGRHIGPLRHARRRWLDHGGAPLRSRPARTGPAWRSRPVRGSVCPSRSLGDRFRPTGSSSRPRGALRTRRFPLLGLACPDVAGGRLLTGLRGLHLREAARPITARTTAGRRFPCHVLSSSTKSEEIRVAGTDASGRDPLRGLGRRLEGNGLGQRGPAAERHRPVSRPGPADPDPGGRRRGDVPLPAAAPALAGLRSSSVRCSWGSCRLAGRATASSQVRAARRMAAPVGAPVPTIGQ